MTGQRVGYVRVSTLDQNIIRQLEGVDVDVDVDRVFEDKASGRDLNRPDLEEMIKFVRDGDIVLVHFHGLSCPQFGGFPLDRAAAVTVGERVLL